MNAVLSRLYQPFRSENGLSEIHTKPHSLTVKCIIREMA